MNEKYREAIATAEKIWAFFVGFEIDNRYGQELLDDANRLRKFLQVDMFDHIMTGMRSSELIPKQRSDEDDCD